MFDFFRMDDFLDVLTFTELRCRDLTILWKVKRNTFIEQLEQPMTVLQEPLTWPTVMSKGRASNTCCIVFLLPSALFCDEYANRQACSQKINEPIKIMIGRTPTPVHTWSVFSSREFCSKLSCAFSITLCSVQHNT